MTSLRDWRQARSLTLDAVAAKLGMPGKNPARTVQRIETGELEARADLVADIAKLTRNEVTAAELTGTRLAWLEANGRRRWGFLRTNLAPAFSLPAPPFPVGRAHK
jgi:transcriptional regulator with XRE-family HTH domain